MLTDRNIVATVNLECRLDLKTIALHARNAEYNPKVSQLPGVIASWSMIAVASWRGGKVPTA